MKAKRKSSKKYTPETYKELISNIRPTMIVQGTYTGITTNIDHLCTVCNKIWHAQPRQVISNKECPECFYRRVSFTTEQFLEKMIVQNSDFTLIGSYKNAYTPTLFKHSCGHIVNKYPEKMMYGKVICRNCHPVKLTRNNWGIAVTNEFGDFPSKLEAECGVFLYKLYGSTNINRYKPYTSDSNHNCDFYIISLDLWIEISSIGKAWYLTRIENKRKLVTNFIFANSLVSLQSQLYDYTNQFFIF